MKNYHNIFDVIHLNDHPVFLRTNRIIQCTTKHQKHLEQIIKYHLPIKYFYETLS